MSDEPEKPKNLPGRHQPRISELSKETTEEDLWDLEDDMSPAPAKPQSQADSPPEPGERRPLPSSREIKPLPRASKPTVARHQPHTSSAPATTDEEAHDPTSLPKAARLNGPRTFDPKSSTPLPEEPQPKSEEPAAEIEKPAPKSESGSPESEPSQPKPAPARAKAPGGKGEKVGLIAFGVVFLALGIWWISGLFSSVPTTRLGDNQPDFPAKGEYLTIEKAETFWRKPIRDGANPDVARREVEFIPVLSVSIDESESGVLRTIFRNEEGDFVGDSISQQFGNGVFAQNSNVAIEFPATDGFMNSAEFNGYRMGDTRWTVEVFEGPSSDAAGSEFKLLFTSPISPNRQ